MQRKVCVLYASGANKHKEERRGHHHELILSRRLIFSFHPIYLLYSYVRGSFDQFQDIVDETLVFLPTIDCLPILEMGDHF